jgi:HAE1 family hydrophobic/amphiphilic exporter-1
MKIASFTVRHPLLTTMAALIVLILGFIAYRRLPIDLMPDISYPVLSISTNYPNASPQIVEQLITRPIEEAMAALPGVEEISSVSAEGGSSVQLSFAWGTNLEEAANDIRDRLDRVIDHLPEEADRPHLFKFDPSSSPILFLGAYGEIDPLVLRRILDEQVAYRLERVPGVASVDVFGGRQRQIQINLLAERMKTLQVPVEQVLARIGAANLEAPLGTIYQGNYQRTLRASALFMNLDQLRNTVVAAHDGAVIRLSQLAEIVDGSARETRIARINGRPGIRIAVSKQSGKNTVEVARQVRRELETIKADFPQVQFVALNDTSRYIRNAIGNVANSAFLGALFAIAVLLFFLQNLRSTLIISISIPFSIIATFVLMYFSRFTLNTMSLGGLALGVGMMVDNSIVVLENIFRLRRGGLEARTAATEGTGEVTSAIIASTLTTVIVFLPLIFIRGVSGVMYQQLAIVVSFSLLCSLASALTLVPMLASRLLARLRTDGELGGNERPALAGMIGGWLSRFQSWYQGILGWALDHRRATALGVILLLAASLLLVPLIGSELMPATDEGQVRVSGEMELGTRLEITDETFRFIEKKVEQAVPEMDSMLSSVGGGFRSAGSSSGQISINLKPRGQRSRSDMEVAEALRRSLAGTPGLTLRTRTGQGFFLMRAGSLNTEQVQIEIRGYDLPAGRALAARVKSLVETVDGVTDAQFSREAGMPEEQVLVDRQRAAELNLTMQQVASLLTTLVAGSQAGTYREAGSEYPILVRLKDADKLALNEILDVPAINGEGQAVSLRNLLSVQRLTGPTAIERRNQERVISVFANTGGRNTAEVIARIRERLREVVLPQGFTLSFVGNYEQQQESFRELLISVLLSLALVYMIMVALYESLRDPFIVMFSVPLAAIGVLLMLFLTRTTFNIQTGIGALMLGGIVVNNAIILVDYTNLLRRRDRLGLREALVTACSRRLRPVLMTSLTTILGLTPLALGLGEGGEVQASLARTVIGGLMSSTFITLVFVPVVYMTLEGRRERRRARRLSRAGAGGEG